MQEHRAAAAGNARRAVVVDLDDEVVEVIVARETVAGRVSRQPDRLVVTAVVRVFAPGVLGANRAGRQEGLRPPVAVGAPSEF